MVITRAFEVLLIEDNQDDVFLTQEAFRENGIKCNLQVAKDGEEGLGMIKGALNNNAALPDIILLDLNLPRKSGKEVLQELKKDDRLKTIPVAILTTSSSASDILDCYRRYANCYITKSLDIDEFAADIKKVKEFWFKTVELPGGA